MSLTDRENYLRNVTMTGPEWIPMNVYVSDAARDQYRDEMEEVMACHPAIFRDFEKGRRNYADYEFAPAYREGERFTDAWGCVWMSDINGIEGQVIEHPLDDWSKLKDYKVPDPLETADRGPATWEQDRKRIREAKEKGDLTAGGVPHGFLYMRLTYLRGFENTMIDVATEDPHLQELIDRVVAHNERLVGEWLKMQPDVMSFGEDLGTQKASVLSPGDFRRWIAPGYKRLIKPCRDAGCQVYLHSDGYIMELVDDLIDCGLTILNPQDLCNGIDNIAASMKGRVCISLDIDRQKVVPFGTRKDIHDLIEEEVRKLGSPQGGLEMVAGIYPPTPPENVDALCEAMEEFRTYWWNGRG
jgi:uroporphyrinogen-III decarboxylase